MVVTIAPEAAAQAEAIDNWWRANRPAARDLFASELDSATLSIVSAPRIGQPVEHPSRLDVRRLLLRATRFHVYYRLRGEDVEVIAVWSCRRGRGPDLAIVD